MRIAFYIIGTLAVAAGVGLAIATQLSKLSPLTGYTAGAFVALAGAVNLVAGAKHYRGHWAFVTGIVLSTLGLASLGTEIDEFFSGGGTEGFLFGLFLSIAFMTFGALSLWSGQKLHRCTLELDRLRKQIGN